MSLFFLVTIVANTVHVIAAESISKGLEIVYNETESTDTEKVIDVYYRGIPGIISANISLELSTKSAIAVEFDAVPPKNGTKAVPTINTEKISEGIVHMAIVGTEPVDSENKFGTITISVPSDIESFKIEVVDGDITTPDFMPIAWKDLDSSSTIVEGKGEYVETDIDTDIEKATEIPESSQTPSPSETPSPTPTPTVAPPTKAPESITRPAQMNKPAATENPESTIESADDENMATAEPTSTPASGSEFTGEGGEVALESFVDTSKWAPTIGEMVKQDWISLKISGTYGSDYIAKYDGVSLSNADFNDMVNGYDPDVSVNDLIANISIQGKFGTTIEIAPVYAENSKYYIVDMRSSAAIGVYRIEIDPNGGVCDSTLMETSENKLKELPEAEKEGYILTGWTENGTDLITEETEFDHNTTITALWETAPEPTASPKPADFKDLDSVPWAEMQITALANLGILNGKTDDEFYPNDSVTRAEYTKMVCSALKIEPDKDADEKFEDVPESHWAFAYVAAAENEGIVNGVSDDEFAPDKTITRQEMATILYRAIDAKGKLMPDGIAKEFDDEKDIAKYAKTAVEKLSAAGVINGVSEKEFAPEETATRAQAACIIYQYFQAVGVATIFN